jgi:hypothetical protein
VCVWLGPQVNFITKRHAFLRMLEADAGRQSHLLATEYSNFYPMPKRRVPLVAKILGEQAYSMIVLPERYSPDLIDEATRLFPESVIEHVTGGLDGDSEKKWLIDVTKY